MGWGVKKSEGYTLCCATSTTTTTTTTNTNTFRFEFESVRSFIRKIRQVNNKAGACESKARLRWKVLFVWGFFLFLAEKHDSYVYDYGYVYVYAYAYAYASAL